MADFITQHHSKLIDEPAVLQSFLNDNIWGRRYHTDLFPLKYTPRLNVKYRLLDKGASVAAELVSWGSEAPHKTRETADVKFMELNPIRVKRTLNEAELNEYDDLKAQPQPPAAEIMDYIFGDAQFVYDAIMAEREYLCLRALCSFDLSTTDLDVADNPNMPVQTTIDYGLAAANKRSLVGTDANRKWGTGSDSQVKPITDFYELQDAIEDAGKEPARYAFMCTNNFREFIKADEVVDFAGPMIYNQPPRAQLNGVNAALSQAGLPQVVVINTRIRRQRTRTGPVEPTAYYTTVDPWTDNYVVFSPTLQCGDLLYTDPPAKGREPNYMSQAYRNGILVSKWSTADPIMELTKGESVCFPVIPNVYNMWRLNVNANNADGLDN